MKRQLDHRFVAIKHAVDRKEQVPDESKEAELYRLLQGKKVSYAVTRAYDIYQHVYKREILESLLLARVEPKEIEDIAEIHEEVTDAYRHLFFDTTTFEDELDRIQYGKTYTRTEFGQDMKEFAVDMGAESLKIRVSRGSYKIPASRVQNEIRATAYLMSQRAKVSGITTDEAKESWRWATLALKASANDDEADVAGIEEVQMALKTEDETTNEEKSDIKSEDILH